MPKLMSSNSDNSSADRPLALWAVVLFLGSNQPHFDDASLHCISLRYSQNRRCNPFILRLPFCVTPLRNLAFKPPIIICGALVELRTQIRCRHFRLGYHLTVS